MATEIRVPSLGESVVEATVGQWFKQAGDAVAADEPLVELETDKVTVEVNAPASGTLQQITADSGATVSVGAILGALQEGAGPAKGAAKPAPAAAAKPAAAAAPAAKPAPAAAAPAKDPGPAARKLLAENKVDVASIPASGKDGRVTKGDVQAAVARGPAPAPTPAAPHVPRELGA